jgi:hypothetical protein
MSATTDPVPTLDEIDEQLKRWEAQVARVKTNLDLLQDAPAYVLISRGLKLSGRTSTEVVAPILAARDLADQYELLAGQVARARLLRDSLRRLLPANGLRFLPPNKDTLHQIDQILNQPCIPLPAAQIPLAERGLLDDPSISSQLSLRQLVDAMTRAFAAARDGVTRYDQVMDQLTPELKNADDQLALLAQRAEALGQQAVAALEYSGKVLRNARQQALDDPLGAEVGFTQAAQRCLADLGRQLDAMEHERTSVADDLKRAQARQSRAERTRGLDPSQVADLGNWLEHLAGTVQAGQYSAAHIGLQRWNAAADSPYAAEEQRQEQLGLVGALRAMVQRRRERGAGIEPGLDALLMEAESALRQRPADLARAKRLVERCQRSLTGP